MRLAKFMKEDTTDALNVDEPEVAKKYSEEYVAKRISIIQDALKKVRGKSMDDEAKEAIMADLNDKLDKWENVDKETKAPEPAPTAETPEDGEEEAPAEEEEEPAPDDEKEAEDKAKEEEEKDVDKEKEEEEKEKKRIKDAEDREKRQDKSASENVRLIKTKIKRRV
jgi:hypothetical protein